MKRTDIEQERKVVELARQGHSARSISRDLRIPFTTVRAILERYHRLGEPVESETPDSPSVDDGDDEPEPVASARPLNMPRRVNYSGSTGRAPAGPRGLKTLSDEVAALRRELEIVTAQRDSLNSRLAEAEAANAASGMAGSSVAGRPSLADFRESTWRRFAGTVLGLPNYVSLHGLEETTTMVAATLTADLYTLALGSPRTPREARMRQGIEHLLTDPAKLPVLLGRDYAGYRIRTLFLKLVARAFYLPSVGRLFEKSAETPVFPEGMFPQ